MVQEKKRKKNSDKQLHLFKFTYIFSRLPSGIDIMRGGPVSFDGRMRTVQNFQVFAQPKATPIS